MLSVIGLIFEEVYFWILIYFLEIFFCKLLDRNMKMGLMLYLGFVCFVGSNIYRFFFVIVLLIDCLYYFKFCNLIYVWIGRRKIWVFFRSVRFWCFILWYCLIFVFYCGFLILNFYCKFYLFEVFDRNNELLFWMKSVEKILVWMNKIVFVSVLICFFF